MDLLRCFGNIAVDKTVYYSWESKNMPVNVDYLFVDYSYFVEQAAYTVLGDIMEAMPKDIIDGCPGWQSLKTKYPYLPTSYVWTNFDSVITEYQRIFHKVIGTDLELLDYMIIQTSQNIFRDFLELLKPVDEKNMMIAMDGVTPLADIMQKRHRNYLNEFQSLYTKRIIEGNNENSFPYKTAKGAVTWNFQKLNPGTRFMEDLFAYLRDKYLTAKISGADEPGETWNKFHRQMQKWSVSYSGISIYFYGDPDKILPNLLLGVRDTNLCFRYHNHEYEHVDVKELRRNMYFYFYYHPTHKVKSDSRDLVDSMAYLQLLYRNNYLPRLEVLTLVEDNYFRMFVEMYLVLYHDQFHEHLILKKKLNYKFLGRLLYEIDQFVSHYAPQYDKYINYNIILENPNYLAWTASVSSKLTILQTWYDNPKYALFVKQTLDVDNINYTCANNEKLVDVLKTHSYTLPELKPRNHKAEEIIPDYHAMPTYRSEVIMFHNVLSRYDEIFSKKYEKDVGEYYRTYFGSEDITIMASVSTDYLQGLLWMFNHYFNPSDKLSFWYYPYLKAQRMNWIKYYLDSLNPCEFLELMVRMANDYEVMNTQLMTPAEELCFITPKTTENLTLLPSGYRMVSGILPDMFPDVAQWVKQTWQDRTKNEVSSLVQTRAATNSMDDACLLKLPPPDISLLRSFLATLP